MNLTEEIFALCIDDGLSFHLALDNLDHFTQITQ